MNTLEKNILELLSSDARLGAEAIASMLGEQPSAVKALIRSLEERGANRQIHRHLQRRIAGRNGGGGADRSEGDAQKGRGLRLDGQADRGARGSKRGVSHERRLRSRVFVECASLKKVARFVSERISTFEGVLSTATHFILKKYKIEGALTERADTDNRLSVQP